MLVFFNAMEKFPAYKQNIAGINITTPQEFSYSYYSITPLLIIKIIRPFLEAEGAVIIAVSP